MGAIHHVTPDLTSLSYIEPYNGQDHLEIDDGLGLSISHFGNSFI